MPVPFFHSIKLQVKDEVEGVRLINGNTFNQNLVAIENNFVFEAVYTIKKGRWMVLICKKHKMSTLNCIPQLSGNGYTVKEVGEMFMICKYINGKC